ncbi:transcription factor bHLH103-like isoform X3 [Gossypium hirsutum]|uniref:Transcription factor bHLH103-like isoform X3 n=1 Tax=Gossypium hirsutum TaxID=3635 RepID=A0ABM2ZZM1_GOSHI|nr:transcription factor bHLH103-like isoform X3 [Gossypium hirsutum]
MSREKLRRAALPPVQERNRRKPEELNAGKKVNSRKVRKEKLGDRITALHQLLSPFGKSAKEKQFLYDIVANGQNVIDVDK